MTTRRAPEAVLVALAEAACKLDHRLSTTGHFGAEERRALNDAAVAYRAAVAPLRTRASERDLLANALESLDLHFGSEMGNRHIRLACESLRLRAEPTADETDTP